ncbi:hypothetical protein NLU13_7234 [Sarocladium strictum]|uniref:BZIP domain-containing protein n=1 Tax=Sarocladium strictum TaxID=5046 RepID=A0AA39GCR9_SARSR|nr:hypothetical protein NLU13_7234 [Sarocladium strictum]
MPVTLGLATISPPTHQIRARVGNARTLHASSQLRLVCSQHPLSPKLTVMDSSNDTSTLARGKGGPFRPTIDPPARSATKRAKPSGKQNGEQSRKRARGRPRLGLDAATVADRRRAQLRVAQRAYRDRKESTLTKLERDAHSMQQKHQILHSDLTSLYDDFLAKGLGSLAPDITGRLKSLVEQSVAMIEHSSPAIPQESEPSGANIPYSANAVMLTAFHTPTSALLPGPDNDISLGLDAVPNGSTSPETQILATKMRDPTTYTSLNTMERIGFSAYNGGDPFTPMPMYIDCVGWTGSYAFREKTFGRRMQRTALEAAIEMCQEEYPDPDCYTAIFGFCLLWESRDDIRARVARLVQRSTSETLDDWTFPLPASVTLEVFQQLSHLIKCLQVHPIMKDSCLSAIKASSTPRITGTLSVPSHLWDHSNQV